MKKHLLFLLMLCSAGTMSSQVGWQHTNLTSVTYLPITDANVHNNQMYATVFNGFTAALYRLNSDNTSWTTINTGSITAPKCLQSAGSRLYMSTLVSSIYSMLYYTTDGGSTFTIDTAGIPAYFSGVDPISGIQYHNGKVIVHTNSGYYIKDTSAASFHHIDVPTAFTGADPLGFLNDTLVGYDNTGASAFYVSGDYGSTWTYRPNNLPAGFVATRLTSNNTNRLYIAGTWGPGSNSGLYYSDDMGLHWTLSTNAASFIHLNAGGTVQLITGIYANGNELYLSLENNANSSAPDIISTTTGLAGLAYDTLGLPTNAAAGVNGSEFQVYQGHMTLALNVIDLYIKDAVSGIAENNTPANLLAVYPNPANDRIFIANPQQLELSTMELLNAAGQVVWSRNGMTNEIDLSELPAGIYLLRVYSTQANSQEVHRVVKQ